MIRIALAALMATAAVGSSRASPQLVVARVSAPPAQAEPGASFRLSVVLVDRARHALRRLPLSYTAMPGHVRLASEVLHRRLRPGRRLRHRVLLRLPGTLAPGNYRILTCAGRRSCVRSGSVHVNSLPALPVLHPSPIVTIAHPLAGATTSGRSVTFDGTASGESQNVTVTVSGAHAATLTAARAATGTWSVTTTLPYGSYTAVASQTDSVGATGTSAADSFDVPAILAAAGDIASCDETKTPWTVASGQPTAALLAAIGPDVVAPLGDNAYQDGTLAEYQRCYGPTWGMFLGLTRPAAGNHEYTSKSGGGYFSYFAGQLSGATNGWYSYDLGRWHVVVLNTSDGCAAVPCGAGSDQEKWLKSDLAAHRGACTLAYWHHPLYTSDNEAPGVVPETATRPFWQDLRAAGADLILNGHAHMYERFAPQDANGNADANGVTEIVAGTGGFSEHTASSPRANNSLVLNNTTFGVLELWLGARGYRYQFVPAAGANFTDSGTGSCHETG